MTIEDQNEIRNLHQEWFPIPYGQDFFDRIKKSNVIAIGCFYKLSDRDVIIGTIMSKIQTESDHNQEVFNRLDEEEEKTR